MNAAPLRLNYGCGNTKKPGFVNVDLRPDSAADVVAEAWDASPFVPGSADLIYSRHMIEHLEPEDARKTLFVWYGLLKPGGLLNVVVPDILFHARQLLGLAQGPFADQARHAWAGFWGWRDEARGGSRIDVHRWGYTEATLTEEVARAGFGRIVRLSEGADSEPWHLNLAAQKAAPADAPLPGGR